MIPEPPPLPEDRGHLAPPPPTGPAEEAAKRLRERAVLHRTEQTRTYPCLQCGGELVWDIGQQLLRCPYCGNEQQVLDPEAEVVEQDFRAAVTVVYGGSPFQVFINGITGEVQGQRPYSTVKIVLAVTAAVIVAIVLWVVFGSSGEVRTS